MALLLSLHVHCTNDETSPLQFRGVHHLPESNGRASTSSAKDGLEGSEVGVDIGEDGEAHDSAQRSDADEETLTTRFGLALPKGDVDQEVPEVREDQVAQVI